MLEVTATEFGGFKEIVLGLEGDILRRLAIRKRRPSCPTRSANRIERADRTSAAMVAVLPEPEDVEVDIKPD